MSSTTVTSPRPTSPYKGLTNYSEQDAQFFFGRRREGDAIIARLKARRLTLLYGESGVGKSSLLRAGVAARLREAARQSARTMETPEFVPVVFSAWRDDPLGGLVQAIEDSVGEFAPPTAASDPPSLESAIRSAGDRTDAYLLVILDQFEDYFLYQGAERDEPFARQLVAALSRPGLPAGFLISIREDALAKLDRFKRDLPKLFDSSLRVGHLDPRSAREAIVAPVERYNELVDNDERISIEPALVDAVIEQRVSTDQMLREQTGRGEIAGLDNAKRRTREIEAPYLQLVMTRLWEAEPTRQSRTMRLETLTSLGGAREIVRTHLDMAMADLPPAQRVLAADMFRQLVTSSGARIAHSTPDLADYSGHSVPEVEAVLGELVGEKVRILVRVPSPDGQERFAIYHDLLAAAALDWRTRQEKDRLESERRRAEEKARVESMRAGRFKLLAVCTGLLALIALAAFAYALHQRAVAVRTALVSQSDVLASQTADAPDLQFASLLALEAYRLAPTVAVRSAILGITQGQLGTPLIGSNGPARAVAFSPNDEMLAVAGADGVRLWSVATQRELGAPLSAGDAAPDTVAFSPDGRTLAAGGDNGIMLWNVANRDLIRTITGLNGAVNSVAFDPRGEILASGDRDGKVRFWSPATGTRIGSAITANTGGVLSVAFSPDGASLASGGVDNKVLLWSVATHRKIGRPLSAGYNYVNSVAFSPRGGLLAAGSGDANVRLWNLHTYRQVATLAGHTDLVLSVAFSPDGSTLASGSFDHTIRLWSVVTHRELGTPLTGHTGPVNGVAFSPDGKTLASASSDDTVRLWDVSTHRAPAEVLKGSAAGVMSVAFDPDGKILASGDQNQTVRLWDLATLRELGAPLVEPDGYVRSVAFSPSGRLLAEGTASGRIFLWNVATQRQFGRTLVGNGQIVFDLAFSPDGRTLASADLDNRIRLWNVDTQREIGTPLIAGGPVRAVDFDPRDGNLLASGGEDSLIRLWNVATRRQLAILRGNRDFVDTLAFSPDGTMLASGSRDETIRLWDWATRRQIGAPLNGDTGAVRSIAFSPNGKTLVSGSLDKTVRLWDVATHIQLGASLTGNTASVYGVAFSPQGHLIASASDDHTIRLWPYPSIRHDISELCRYIDLRRARNLWGQNEPSIPYRKPC